MCSTKLFLNLLSLLEIFFWWFFLAYIAFLFLTFYFLGLLFFIPTLTLYFSKLSGEFSNFFLYKEEQSLISFSLKIPSTKGISIFNTLVFDYFISIIIRNLNEWKLKFQSSKITNMIANQFDSQKKDKHPSIIFCNQQKRFGSSHYQFFELSWKKSLKDEIQKGIQKTAIIYRYFWH